MSDPKNEISSQLIDSARAVVGNGAKLLAGQVPMGVVRPAADQINIAAAIAAEFAAGQAQVTAAMQNIAQQAANNVVQTTPVVDLVGVSAIKGVKETAQRLVAAINGDGGTAIQQAKYRGGNVGQSV